MTLSFVINRKPVSVNATYLRAGFGAGRGKGGGKGFILSPEARDFKAAARSEAFVAAKTHGWPKPESVKAVALEFTTWNTRHDADACIKIASDSFESVLYVKDNVVQSVKAGKAKDTGAPRIHVKVTLLEPAA